MNKVEWTTITTALISSGVVGVIFTYLNSAKENVMKRITDERKIWRNTMRRLGVQIYESEGKNLQKKLNELKLRINSYGASVNNTSISQDWHIWRIIHSIEKDLKMDKKINLNKKQAIVEYISLLIKRDWDRSKREVRNSFRKMTIVFVICFLLFYSKYCFLSQDIFKNRSHGVIYQALYIFSVFIIVVISYYILNKYVENRRVTLAMKNENLLTIEKLKKLKKYFEYGNIILIMISACVYVICSKVCIYENQAMLFGLCLTWVAAIYMCISVKYISIHDELLYRYTVIRIAKQYNIWPNCFIEQES